jgi:hypothetical protein
MIWEKPLMRAFLLLLWSSSAFAACPDLAGTYANCRALRVENDPGIARMVVAQDGNKFAFTSVDGRGQESGAAYIADGQARSETSQNPNEPATQSVSTATCDDTHLNVVSKITIAQLGLTLDMNETLSRTAKGDLEVDLSMNGSAPRMVVCTRQQ